MWIIMLDSTVLACLSAYYFSTHLSFTYLQLGFDALYFSRIDYQDREKRKATKSLEVVWRGSRSLGSSADVSSTTIFWYLLKDAEVYGNSISMFYQLFDNIVCFQIFTGIFPINYEPPPGDFYFEVNDQSPVIQVSPWTRP